MSRYLRILRRSMMAWPFATSVAARLPISMGPLGMVILIQHVRGSYSIAGAVTAAFAVSTSLATPAWGRLLDRFGQPRVIGPTSTASGVLLALLAVAAVRGWPDLALLALAAGVGLTFPPFGPAVRGAYRVALDQDADRRAAYALDAVAVELIFVVGPVLLSVLLVLAPPAVPLLVTALLMAVGGLGYSATAAARRWRPEVHHRGAGHRSGSPLRSRGVPAVLTVTLALAVGFGLNDVAIAATARETLGSQARVGLLFAAIAGGSALGGLWYGSRAWVRPERLRYPVTLTGFTAGLAALATLLLTGTARLPVLLPLLFVTGLSIAPGLIIAANLIDHLAPNDRLSEAQAWFSTGFTTGGAAGTALAGVLVDAGGPGRAFGVAALAVLAAVVVSVLAQGRWRPGDQEHADELERSPDSTPQAPSAPTPITQSPTLPTR